MLFSESNLILKLLQYINIYSPIPRSIGEYSGRIYSSGDEIARDRTIRPRIISPRTIHPNWSPKG